MQRFRTLSGAQWGALFGTAGALIGYGSAFGAVLHALSAGQITPHDAGVTLGGLGAATGATCAAIGLLSQRWGSARRGA